MFSKIRVLSFHSDPFFNLTASLRRTCSYIMNPSSSLFDVSQLAGLVGASVWSVDLGSILDEFHMAIKSIDSVAVTSPNHEKVVEKLSLTSAAYILGHVTALWSRRVDELKRDSQRILDLLSSHSTRNTAEDGDGFQEEVKKARAQKR